MKLHADNPDSDVRIELLPLIDVIFCILTFFMLAAVTLTRQTAINVDIPKASTGATQMRDMLIVSVDPVGQTYLDQRPVSRDELYQSLLNYQRTTPQGMIVLYASRLSSYNDVVQVLDLLRSVGGDRVALATLPASQDQVQQQIPGTLPGTLPGTTPGTFPETFPGAAPGTLPGLEGQPTSPDALGLPGAAPLPNLESTPPGLGTLSPAPEATPPVDPAPLPGGTEFTPAPGSEVN